MSTLLLKIDELYLAQHPHLTDNDECYFLKEYVPKTDYSDPTTSLLWNFKKDVAKKDLPEYRYKGIAISKVAAMFRATISDIALKHYTLIPIPQSYQCDDPNYDDRMTKTLNLLNSVGQFDVREVIRLTESYEASHLTENRLNPDQLLEKLEINEDVANEKDIKDVILFDDMITAGSHFIACKRLIQDRFNVGVIGIFIARRLLEN